MKPLVSRVPLPVWVIGAVVAVHALAFWLLADKHFLPKARYLPPPTPAVNFAAGDRSSVDPQTGETTTERQFTVSTRLATPAARPDPATQALILSVRRARPAIAGSAILL